MVQGAERPAISVILPCHNLAGQIGTAIASLRAQRLAAFEGLVIDDGSTDHTRDAAARAIGDDPRFQLIAAPHGGLSMARNLGLDRARGQVIAFLDGDDSYDPDFLHDHYRELMAHDAPWTASGVTLLWQNGRAEAHSAIHGAPAPVGRARWLPLWDACDIAALFPSAWNKLYRRDVIGDLRFRPGALYEDHAFFWALACRTRRLRYLPRALYRYHLGRPGQITAQADARMREHLDRLEEVAQIIRPTGLTRQRTGLSRLATRAVDERLRAAPLPALRDDFLQAAQALFARHGWHWHPDPDIAPGPAAAIDPEMRLSVLVAGPVPAATAEALAAQTLPLAEIREAPPGTPLPQLLARAAKLASPWVAILQPGDRPAVDWAATALRAARREAARLIVSACTLSGARAVYDGGLARPGPAPVSAADLAALILRRDALHEDRAQFATLPPRIAAASLAHHVAAGGVVPCLPQPLLTLAPRAPVSLARTARALARLPASHCSLSPAQRAAIFAHLMQCQLAATPTRPRRYGIALAAGLARARAGLARPDAAPHIGPYLRACLGQKLPG